MSLSSRGMIAFTSPDKILISGTPSTTSSNISSNLIAMQVLKNTCPAPDGIEYLVRPTARLMRFGYTCMTPEDFPVEEESRICIAFFRGDFDAAFFDTIFSMFPRCVMMAIRPWETDNVSRIDFNELARFPLRRLFVTSVIGRMEGIEFSQELKSFTMYAKENEVVDISLISGMSIEYLDLRGRIVGLDSIELPHLREISMDYTEIHNIRQLLSPNIRLPERFILSHQTEQKVDKCDSPWKFDHELTQKLFDKYPSLLIIIDKDDREYVHPSINGFTHRRYREND